MDNTNPEFKYAELKIHTIQPINDTHMLYIAWVNGDEAVVDLGEEASEPKVIDWGYGVEWGDGVDIGSDSLRHLADEKNAIIHRKI